MDLCSVDGCAKSRAKRQWCDMHYRRWLKHGDPLITKKRANGGGYMEAGYIGHQIDGIKKFDHVAIAERAIGKSLPPDAVVHHVNEIRTDNRNENLVICQDRAYHNLIHMRTDAYNACGNANWRRCAYCKQYDSPENLTVMANYTRAYHKRCANEYNLKRLESLK